MSAEETGEACEDVLMLDLRAESALPGLSAELSAVNRARAAALSSRATRASSSASFLPTPEQQADWERRMALLTWRRPS